MINNMLPSVYDDCKVSLKAASYDSDNKTYVSESSLMVYNFDEKYRGKPSVMEKYYEVHKLLPVTEKANSCDAFYVSVGRNNEKYLIEFKNSPLSNIDHTNMKEKLLGSLLVLTDIYQAGISDFRKNITFMLVYSNEKDRLKERASDRARSSRLNFTKYEKIYYKQCIILGDEKFQQQFVDSWEKGEVKSP